MYSGILQTAPPTKASFDFLFNWYLISGAVAFAFVAGLLLFLVLKYRDKPGAKVEYIPKKDNWKIALAVVVIMGTVLAGAGYQTFAAAGNIEIPHSANSVTIKVTGFQWGWNFSYPNGAYAVSTEGGVLTVPVNTVVIINLTSKDVLHTFGIPSYAVKEDANPGKITQLWFEATQVGNFSYAIRCFELCGVGHAYMTANLTVVSQAQWAAWMQK